MRIVLDMNVLVSGLLQPFGPAGQIVRLAASGELVLYHDSRILATVRSRRYCAKSWCVPLLQVDAIAGLGYATTSSIECSYAFVKEQKGKV